MTRPLMTGMRFGELVELFDELEATSSNLEMTEILASFLGSVDDDYLELIIPLLRGSVFPAWDSRELGVSTSLTMEAISKATGVSEQEIEEFWAEEGDLGSAADRAVRASRQQHWFSTDLTVSDVHNTLVEIADYTGEGSQTRKVDQIAKLVSAAGPREARYIVRIVLGTMRLGVGEGTIRDAIAYAFLDGTEDAIQAIERGYEVTNDFRIVARTAKDAGRPGLDDLTIEVFRPVKVMLAEKAETIESAFHDTADTTAGVYAEYKYDGMRTQVHSSPDRTEVFTRRLENVTTQFPEIVDRVETHVTSDEFILEGEAVAFEPDSHDILPFQKLSQRIKRKYDIEAVRREIPVVVYVFDILYIDGESLLDRPLRDRLGTLADKLTPSPWEIERAQHTFPDSLTELREFYRDAVAGGHEGIMVKNLNAAYQPGTRVGYMMKVKPTMEPLDLVVTRAQWSEGRKSDWLGRLYLACRDEASGDLLEIGRMSTGMTDEELEGITSRLEPLITDSAGREVEVIPETVIEVECEEIQESPTYASGYALRFPRFRRFRDDLSIDDVDTLETVEALYEEQ